MYDSAFCSSDKTIMLEICCLGSSQDYRIIRKNIPRSHFQNDSSLLSIDTDDNKIRVGFEFKYLSLPFIEADDGKTWRVGQ